MLGIAGRRLAEGLVALFALLGFTLVPLGQRTALEHTRDIFTTPAAVVAFRELGTAALRLRDKVTSVFVRPAAGPDADASDQTGSTKTKTGPSPTPEVPDLPPGRPTTH
jgi:hypothetical protein